MYKEALSSVADLADKALSSGHVREATCLLTRLASPRGRPSLELLLPLQGLAAHQVRVMVRVGHQLISVLLEIGDHAPLGTAALQTVAVAHGLELDQLWPRAGTVLAMFDDGLQDPRVMALRIDDKQLATAKVQRAREVVI